LTQDLCRACAVPAGQVQRALDELGLPGAEVISLDPLTLEDVIAQIETVGGALDAKDVAAELTATLRARVARVKETSTRVPILSVFPLEWSEPPFGAGHWIPEMIELAGGTPVLSEKGQPSRETAWHEIRTAAPEVVVFMPCGYYLEEAVDEGAQLFEQPEFASTPAARDGAVFAVDATSYFSRPGPRAVDGLEMLAWAIHPDAFPEPAPGSISRLGG
jgi:iron complex transport system substrate-binding protein